MRTFKHIRLVKLVIATIFFVVMMLVATAVSPGAREAVVRAVLAQQEVLLQGIDSSGTIRTVLTDSSGRVITSGSASSGAGTVAYQCATRLDTVTDVDTTAVAVPASDQASRISLLVCNSAENSGAPLLKCRGDGTSPAMGSTTPGVVLNKGDCVVYTNTGVRCISDTANTAAAAYECGP